MIGAGFGDTCNIGFICGVVISLRRRASQPSSPINSNPAAPGASAKLSLWLRDAGDKERVQEVGQLFREVLALATAELDPPRGGWKLAFEDFRSRAVTMRV